jgi:formate/nitrite transporter FocA (FNT family)
MNKIKEWLYSRRTAIGYTIGGANIVSGILNLVLGNMIPGLFFVGIGAFIIVDARTYQ